MTRTSILAAISLCCGLTFAACSSDETTAETLICSDAASEDNLDQDGDGFSPCEGDCDDNDPNASPDGVEESETDGYDQDCDNYNPAIE